MRIVARARSLSREVWPALSQVTHDSIVRARGHGVRVRGYTLKLDSTTRIHNGTKSNPNRPVPTSELGSASAGGADGTRLLLLLLLLLPLAKVAACWAGGARLPVARWVAALRCAGAGAGVAAVVELLARPLGLAAIGKEAVCPQLRQCTRSSRRRATGRRGQRRCVVLQLSPGTSTLQHLQHTRCSRRCGSSMLSRSA